MGTGVNLETYALPDVLYAHSTLRYKATNALPQRSERCGQALLLLVDPVSRLPLEPTNKALVSSPLDAAAEAQRGQATLGKVTEQTVRSQDEPRKTVRHS